MQGQGIFRRKWGNLLVMLAAVLLVGCSESSGTGLDGFPVPGPGNDSGKPPHAVVADTPGQDPDLGSCTNLALTRPSKLFSHVYAKGDQVYRWTGSAWVLAGPSATLYFDAALTMKAGTHYAGPTWETNNGSKVFGSVVDRCTVDAGSVQWLLLRADSTKGPAFYKHTTFIHRLNTSGGLAPSAPGTVINQLAHSPYTTEYFFYRDK